MTVRTSCVSSTRPPRTSSSSFHRFLSGRENRDGRVQISLNGRNLEPYDPFHSHHPATQHHPEETVLFDGKEILIRPVTLPHHDKVSPEDWKRYAGPGGLREQPGVLPVSEPSADRSRHLVPACTTGGAHEAVPSPHRHAEQPRFRLEA